MLILILDIVQEIYNFYQVIRNETNFLPPW